MKVILPLLIAAMFFIPNAFSPFFIMDTYPNSLVGKEKNVWVYAWDPEDEGNHFPCGREWWNVDAFFVLEGMGNWSLTASFEYEMETPASNLFLTVFDMDNGDCYSLGSYGDGVETLSHEKNRVELQYYNSWMKGLYPEYVVHFERKNFVINLCCTAVTPPKWVADEISNAILPMGLGYYRYGFIPLCDITGDITIGNETMKLYGSGYYEHVWGNWTYGNPFKNHSDIGNVSSAYINLAKWWLSHHSVSVPSSIAFSSDNNMFGYDWIWSSFDNGWSMFYGNVPFWVCEGPAFGILYLVSDGGQYIEFSNIVYEYGGMVYVEEYDVYYPSEIEINAREGNQILSLHFRMVCDVHTYLDTNLSSSYWQAIFLWESPGYVSGYYFDGEKNITLNGRCEMEPERQVSRWGHTSLSVNFTTLPDGLGIEILFISHFLGAGVEVIFQLFPLRFSIRFLA
ncbi:MAG: hypothetical protein U9O96_04980 [Candidatus Thermoplasmatota archaeon]|nr:hypothetical protein [Candidatus Thermoplasmatota archaeon]